MDKKLLNSMFDALLHIGNKSNYWNPKMKGYIYGVTNGIHVFNLIKTVNEFENLKNELVNLTKEGKKILFVSTKLQARDAFSKLAIETGNYHVSEKWVPGLLTNFKTIRKRINTYIKLLADSEGGAFDILPKKEKAAKLHELEKLDRAFKGLKDMRKLPDVIFVVDGAFERQAIKEANTLKIPAYAVLSTNGNPDLVKAFIPANTNSVKSLDFIADVLKKELSVVKPMKKAGSIKKIEDKKTTVKETAKKEEK